MRSIASCCLILGMGLVSVAATGAGAQDRPNKLTANEAAQGWKLLFDGKNLDGWQPYSTSAPPATGDWSVAHGAIVCPGTSSGWLASNDSYTNFELKLQFRGSEKVNSGVFLRSTKAGAPHQTGYECKSGTTSRPATTPEAWLGRSRRLPPPSWMSSGTTTTSRPMATTT